MVVRVAVAVAVAGMTEVALPAVFSLMFLVILSAHIKHFNGLFYAKKKNTTRPRQSVPNFLS